MGGFCWFADRFKENKARVVKKMLPGSLVDLWNREQLASGLLEFCIQPGDEVVSANGMMNPDEIDQVMAGEEVLLEFRRAVKCRSEIEACDRRPRSSGIS